MLSVGVFFGLFLRGLIRKLVVAVKLHLTPIVIAGLTWVGTVLVVIHLAGQAIGSHTLLGGHFVGAHLQRYCSGVTVLQLQLLVKNVPPGSWGCHARLMDEWKMGYNVNIYYYSLFKPLTVKSQHNKNEKYTVIMPIYNLFPE